MTNDHLDPLSDEIADLLAAERSAPGIPDVVRARLSRRLADSPPSTFAISQDAVHAAVARRHSTAMLMVAAGMALIVGVGAGLVVGGLADEVRPAPAVATRMETTPHRASSPVIEPSPAPTLPPNPTPAAAPPTPMPTPIAITPPPAGPSKKRAAAPGTKHSAAPAAMTTATTSTPAAMAAATTSAPESSAALSMATPPAPASDEPSPPAAVDDEPASTVVPWTLLVPNLGKPPASHNGENLYMDLARDAVRSDDATTAIALVKAHKKKFPNGHSSEERDLLWVQALIINRKYDSARDHIEKFQLRYPRSTFLPALRKQLSKLSPERARLPRIRSRWTVPRP